MNNNLETFISIKICELTLSQKCPSGKIYSQILLLKKMFKEMKIYCMHINKLHKQIVNTMHTLYVFE